jgi:hypothetical protein
MLSPVKLAATKIRSGSEVVKVPADGVPLLPSISFADAVVSTGVAEGTPLNSYKSKLIVGVLPPVFVADVTVVALVFIDGALAQ